MDHNEYYKDFFTGDRSLTSAVAEIAKSLMDGNDEIADRIRYTYYAKDEAIYKNSKTFAHEKAMNAYTKKLSAKELSKFSGSNSANIVNIVNALNIFNSTMTFTDKLYEIDKLFDSSLKLWNAYLYHAIYFYDKKQIVEVYKMYHIYMVAENTNLISAIRKHKYMEKQIKKLAKRTNDLDAYLMDREISSTFEFAKKNDLTSYTNFDYIQRKGSAAAANAADLVEEKKRTDGVITQNNILHKFEMIKEGIESGVNAKGLPFTLLDFWLLFPYNDYTNPIRPIRSFFQKLGRAEEADFYVKYMVDNKMISKNRFSERNFYSYTETLNGVLFTKEMKDDVINYIKDNDLPLINSVVSAVMKHYIDGTLYEVNVNKRG